MMKRPQESLIDYPKPSGILEEFARISDFGACLVPLLHALGYRGDLRHVAEALPHFAESLDLTAMRNVMANLTFQPKSGSYLTVSAFGWGSDRGIPDANIPVSNTVRN